MQFDSFLFVVFFALVLAGYYSLRSWRQQKLLLMCASYLFYAAWSPPLVVLIWFSTVVDYTVGRRLEKMRDQTARRTLLLVSLFINLGLLGYFKYAEFLLGLFAEAVSVFGLVYHAPDLGIILPIGISFYTFQSISYTIDVYRRRMPATLDFWDFALFVTFFPQLVAGPIVRAEHFLPQCQTPRAATSASFSWGLSLMVFGLFAKIVLADNLLAPVVDQVYADPARYAWVDAGIAALAFSGQIFFDFAGYSLCAIGAALCLGFSLPDNFRSPYAALGVSDFWRRWHISLSTWLRDYLYLPLGGSRVGTGRTSFNLLLTMFIGGIWHGAAMTFVLWGWLHGLLLVFEHGLRRRFKAWSPPPQAQAGLVILTFLVVTLAWIPFRAQGFDNLAAMLHALVRVDGNAVLESYSRFMVLFVIAGTLTWHWFARHCTLEERIGALPPWARGSLVAAMLVAIVLSSNGDSRAFIYFQF
jgi:alginate O-acetyltransferase complex protein AlgI